MEEYKIYVGGSFKTTGCKLEVTNPFDGKPFANTWLAGKEELEDAIGKAKSVEKELNDMPVFKKYSILMRIAQDIKKNRDTFARLLSLEAAKPMKYAIGEVERAAQTFIVAAEEAKRIPAEYFSIDWTEAGAGKEGFVKYFPIGLIAGISPFNFPLNLAVHKIAPSIASGNPIILKPARKTPLSVLELAKIIDRTELPKGSVSMLPMDRVAGNQLVTDERFSMLTFTGSPEVGWKMKNEAGKKKVTLELGGNAGVIIAPDANIQIVAAKCLSGAFAYQGQVCIHVQRIFVHETLFDRFVEAFVRLAESLVYGSPEALETDITAMIDEENAIRVEEWVGEAISQGAKVLLGCTRKDTYVTPTILTSTDKRMKVYGKEIFGPVVVVEKYTDFKEAVEMINDSEYGLQAGVFTNRIDEMNYAFNHLHVGGVMINELPTFRVDHMPYGGVKNSGFGREGLKYAILEMMEPRLMVKNRE